MTSRRPGSLLMAIWRRRFALSVFLALSWFPYSECALSRRVGGEDGQSYQVEVLKDEADLQALADLSASTSYSPGQGIPGLIRHLWKEQSKAETICIVAKTKDKQGSGEEVVGGLISRIRRSGKLTIEALVSDPNFNAIDMSKTFLYNFFL